MKSFSVIYYLVISLLIPTKVFATFDQSLDAPPQKKMRTNSLEKTQNDQAFAHEIRETQDHNCDPLQKKKGSKFDSLNPELILDISTFMSSKDVGRLMLSSKNLHKIISHHSNQPSGWLRAQHPFSVQTKGRWYFLEEFLGLDGKTSVSKISNIEKLSKEKSNQYIQLFLKTLPNNLDRDRMILKHYYQNTIHINRLVKSMPSFSTAREKLTAFILELSFWDYTGDAVWELIRNESSRQLVDSTAPQEWARFEEDLGNEIWRQIDDQIRENLENQIWDLLDYEIWEDTMSSFEIQQWDQYWQMGQDQLFNEIKSFPIATAYMHGALLNLLKPLVDYTFAIYQLGTFAIRNSEEYKSSFNMINKVMNKYITEVEAQEIINKIEIPEISDKSNLVVQIQLATIKNYLK